MPSSAPLNIKELAAILNLSASTVSRVLNGKSKQFRISQATEKKVREAALDFNYSPNRFARGLKLSSSETIGVIVPDISNPFFADIVKIIEKQCRNNGFAIMIGDSDENTDQEIEMTALFESRKVDGIIIAPVGLKFDHLLKIYKRGIPIVIVDRYKAGLSIPIIGSDNYSGAFNAASLLIDNGHKRIACIQGLNNSQTNNSRVEGFIDAMKYHQINEINYFVCGQNFSIENGFQQASALFKMDKRITAILSLNNSISLGIIKAAAENNLSIPSDLSIISFDEMAYSAYLSTPMTTIEQDKKQIAKIAVEMLINQIKKIDIQIDIEFTKIPTKINWRKSICKIV